MKRLLLALFLPALLTAQTTSCSLSGTVQDAGGAVIPGAKVTVTSQMNGFVRTQATNHDGFFSFPDLTASTFTVSVEAPGFKVYKQTGILINANEQRSLERVKLDVGQVSESVTISADAVNVDTSNGERAGTLSGEQLDQIALRGRDLFDAVSLMPGVVDTSDGRDSPSPTSISNIYILGGRNDSKNMTIDGVSNLDTGSNGSVHSMPSIDSVAEVKVLMSAYSAENGRNPSSINVITKGGGTAYHGQVSYYFRNEDLNANSYFSNAAGKPRQEYRYNIGSYSIGGPVKIPKLFDGKKHNVFFFFNQEYQIQVVAYGLQEKTVPTALERSGNFTRSLNTNGSVITINDPANAKKAFPGNIIPASRINPVGQAILNMFPLNNFVDPVLKNTYQWNYYQAASEPYNRRTETGRVDWSPKQNWQLYLSLSNNYDHQNVPYSGGNAGWVAGNLNFLLTPITYSQPGRLATLHSTNTLSPTMFNEASLAVSQNTLTFSPSDPAAVNRTNLGILIPQRNPSLNPLNLIPDIQFNVTNWANPSMNDGTPYFNQNTVYSAVDNISKISGTHTYKTGIYFEHTQKIQNSSAPIRGNISFVTDTNNPLDANDSYANALLGNYDNYAEATGHPQGNFVFNNIEWFVSDTWKVRGNLTLDYGLRFYHDPPQYDARGQLASFSPSAWNPATAPVLLRPISISGTNYAIDPTTNKTYPYGLVGVFVPGVGNSADGQLQGGKNGVPPATYKTAPLAMAPRFGFAWDPFSTGKTAVRGGGGIYFDRIQGNPEMALINNPPGVYSPTQYYGTFADIAASASSAYLAPSGTIYSLASTPHQQQIYNYNLEIDRQIGSNVFTAGYTGSLGRHLLWERNINPAPLGSSFTNLNPQNKNPVSGSVLPTNFLRPYSAYGDLYMYEFANNSNYNGVLLSVQHRFSHGLSLTASYTLSKALDVADSYSTAVDPFLDNKARNYGPAAFNRASVFTTNFVYAMPKPGKATKIRPLGWVADNWTLSGVVRMLTGAPQTPGYTLITGLTAPSGSPSYTSTGGSTGTPPLIRMEVIHPDDPLSTRFGPAPQPAGQGTVANSGPWLSTSTAPEFGNLGKNTVIGPGTNNCDMSLYRQINITERIHSQLRIEAYNVFNHTQFSSINTTAQFSVTGAQVNQQYMQPTGNRPPRYMQVALRIWF